MCGESTVTEDEATAQGYSRTNELRWLSKYYRNPNHLAYESTPRQTILQQKWIKLTITSGVIYEEWVDVGSDVEMVP